MGRGLDWTPSTCTDQSNRTENFYTSTRSMSFAVLTRSSAIAEGPRGASYQLKSCQSPRNSAETTCTSPEQIELMKLEGDNGPMCNKHVHSTMTRSSRFHRPIDVKNKPTIRTELWISPAYRRLQCGQIFQVHNLEIPQVTLTTHT